MQRDRASIASVLSVSTSTRNELYSAGLLTRLALRERSTFPVPATLLIQLSNFRQAVVLRDVLCPPRGRALKVAAGSCFSVKQTTRPQRVERCAKPFGKFEVGECSGSKKSREGCHRAKRERKQCINGKLKTVVSKQDMERSKAPTWVLQYTSYPERLVDVHAGPDTASRLRRALYGAALEASNFGS
jgi:hypothetical protein